MFPKIVKEDENGTNLKKYLNFKFNKKKDCEFSGKIVKGNPVGKGVYTCQREDNILRFEAEYDEKGIQKEIVDGEWEIRGLCRYKGGIFDF